MAKAIGPEEATLTWSGRAVDIEKIESELVRLRYEAAGGAAEGGAVRTSLLNLVIYAPDRKAARQASQVIATLPSHHPSRTIIAVTRPSAAESRTDAELAAHCHISSGLEQPVCCEEVTLTVSGRAAHHLHSIIIPLLVSDLPVYVWWTGELPHNAHALEEWVGSADRFIADSTRFAQAAKGLARLAQLCLERPKCGVGDLNWSRLTTWRQLLAQHCEAPDLKPRLDPITEVEIAFREGGPQRQPSQPYLLLGWLAARFGWETQQASRKGPGGRFMLTSDRDQVSVSMRSVRKGPGLRPGWVASVKLQGGHGGQTSLSLTKTDDPLHLMLRTEEAERVLETEVRIEACDEGEMLVRELDTLGHDAEYEEALSRALSLLGTSI